MYKLFLIKRILVTLIFLILAGCNPIETPVQKTGPTYLSLSPASTEIVYALESESNLVGVTDYCNHPEEAKTKKSVGNFMNPSLEVIFLLNPDIVFEPGLPQDSILNQITNKGIEVITVNPGSIDQLKKDILRLGKITQKKEKSKKLIADIERQIKSVKKKTDQVDKKRVYVEIASNPMMTVGSESFITELIEIGGGINVAGQVKKDYFTTGYEFIVSRNPEIIVLLSKNSKVRKEQFSRFFSSSQSPEIKTVSQEEKDILLRAGPRIGEGAKRIFDIIHDEK